MPDCRNVSGTLLLLLTSRTSQLILLNELSQQLEAELDPPVAAQLAVNTLERAINCSLVTLMMHEAEKQEFVVLAAAGKMTNSIPSGYRQDADSGLLGRTKNPAHSPRELLLPKINNIPVTESI